MKQQDIHNLIERFLDAETTLQEEQMLMEYFRGEDIPEDLMQYREMFLDYGEVASLQPAQEEEAAKLLSIQNVQEGGIQNPKLPPRIKWIWAVAASIAILFAFSIGFLYCNKEEEKQQIAEVIPKQTEKKEVEPAMEEKQTTVPEAPSIPKVRISKPQQAVRDENKEPETLLAETQSEATDAPQANTFSYSISNPERLKYTPEEIAALKRQVRRKYEEWLQLEREIIEYDDRHLSALTNEVEQ